MKIEITPVVVVPDMSPLLHLAAAGGLEEVVVLATTRAVLTVAEKRGLIASAEDVWSDIIKRAEGVNPKLEGRVMRPTRAP